MAWKGRCELGAVLQNGLADPEQAGEPGLKLQGSQAAASRAWLVLSRMTWVCPLLYEYSRCREQLSMPQLSLSLSLWAPSCSA